MAILRWQIEITLTIFLCKATELLLFNIYVDLKWYHDENRIFPIEVILQHKQLVCIRIKMPFTFFKYLFLALFVPEIFKFLN